MNLIESLLVPEAYPHPVSEIRLIETHISWVFLTGDYAYKIKKAIQFDFLDFSSLEKRYFYCQEELRLNCRLAPNLYLKVVPITQTGELVQINGQGEIIEYAVQMRQFPLGKLLSEIAQRSCLDKQTVDQLADVIALFHLQTEIAISNSSYGSIADIEHWFAGNFIHIAPALTQHKNFSEQIRQLESWGKQELIKNTELMLKRKQQGFIRECHGDLHLGNIALFKNKVTPFDALEFNPALRWIDVISEIAFIVMDLQQRDLTHFAWRFLNRYLSITGDYQGLGLLRYYLVYRALVRTKVALLRWQQHRKPADFQEAENYTDLAESFSKPQKPILLITHGYSGSGKSTLGAELAENLGLVHIRSDVERRRLLGVLKQGENREINQGLYSAEKVQFVYQYLADLTADMLSANFSVLVDAAFLQAGQRTLFKNLADEKQVEFLILDFYAPEAELKQRILQRLKTGNDASEASLEVLDYQLKNSQALTEAELKQSIQIDSDESNVIEKLQQQILSFRKLLRQ